MSSTVKIIAPLEIPRYLSLASSIVNHKHPHVYSVALDLTIILQEIKHNFIILHINRNTFPSVWKSHC